MEDCTIIDFTNNQLTEINFIFSKKFESLEEVYFDNNKIREFPENFLWNLKNLKVFSASKNEIEKLNENFFAENLKLKYLNFNSNNLKFISSKIFLNLQNLEFLGFYDNFCINVGYPENDLKIIYLMVEGYCSENRKTLTNFVLKLLELVIVLKKREESVKNRTENVKIGQNFNESLLDFLNHNLNSQEYESEIQKIISRIHENFKNTENLKIDKKSNFNQNSQNFSLSNSSKNPPNTKTPSNIQNKSIENYNNNSDETQLHHPNINNNCTTNCKEESENSSSDLDTLMRNLMWLIIPIIFILTILLAIVSYGIYSKYVMYPVSRLRRRL